MRLDQVLRSEERSALEIQQRELYLRKAVAYLRAQYPPIAARATDSDLRQAVLACYLDGRKFAISLERDHLAFLDARVIWGAGFFENPLLRRRLQRAGLLDTDHKPVAHNGLAQLIDEREDWMRMRAPDMESSARLIGCFHNIYSMHDEPLSYGVAKRHLQECWPATCADLDAEALRSYATVVLRGARQSGLDDIDCLAIICLGVFFGSQMLRDPLYPWVSGTLIRADWRELRRKVAFGRAVLALLDTMT